MHPVITYRDNTEIIRVGMQLYNLYGSDRRQAVTCLCILLLLLLLLLLHTCIRFGLVLYVYDSTGDRDKINIRLINDDYISSVIVHSPALELLFVFLSQLVLSLLLLLLSFLLRVATLGYRVRAVIVFTQKSLPSVFGQFRVLKISFVLSDLVIHAILCDYR